MNIKQDKEIIRVLKLDRVSHLIRQTDLGELSITLRKGSDDYFMTLDSVPLEKYKNDELMKLIFGGGVQKVNK